MKTIVLIRHAKTESYAAEGGDFNRQLTASGLQDTITMARRLTAKQIIPDMIVASMAKRAAQTAISIAVHMQVDEDKIYWSQMLYQGDPLAFSEKISQLPDEVNTAFFIAHNPGITAFANELAHPHIIDHIPTCGMVGLRIDANQWCDVASAGVSFLFFDYPKSI